MANIVGIDLGTTFSAISAVDQSGDPKIAYNGDGSNLTPSCVYFDENGSVEVGEYARKCLHDSTSTKGRFKRQMGEPVKYTFHGREYTPTDLSTFVLAKIKKDFEDHNGPIDEAVVTIPANFSHEARDATMRAAKNAGLPVNFIVNEPTAAAFYYAYKLKSVLNGTYVIFDLGGGTFDVSVIRVEDGDVRVLSTNGVSQLGGDDFDRSIIQVVARKYFDQTGTNLDTERFFGVNDAEEQKKSLSKRDRVQFHVLQETIELTRKEFEDSISNYIAKIEMLCESALQDANLQIDDITDTMLVGGSTRIPVIKDTVRRLFKKEPLDTVNVDEVVALGAALYAAYKSDIKLNAAQEAQIKALNLSEITSKYFGTITLSNALINENFFLTNVTLIRKGEPIPCKVTKSFYTVHPNQTSVKCTVTESSHDEMDPRFVKVIWQGELPLPPGRPANQEIKVNFSYDANQLMKCSFIDTATDKTTAIDLSISDSTDPALCENDIFRVE